MWSTTMSPRGVIYMNHKAWLVLGRPAAIEMMFDKGRRTIGLRKANPDMIEAFPVKDKKGTRSKVIMASAFCTHFLIKMMRTALFREADINEDGIMTLSLDTVAAVTRGAR